MAEGAQQTGTGKTAVRPFHVNVPEAELTDLRSRINVSIRKSCGYRLVGLRLPAQTRTRSQDFRILTHNGAKWPGRETVTDDSQGVPLAMMQELARYWRPRACFRIPGSR
jgi:hypothetical protein